MGAAHSLFHKPFLCQVLCISDYLSRNSYFDMNKNWLISKSFISDAVSTYCGMSDLSAIWGCFISTVEDDKFWCEVEAALCTGQSTM